MLAACLSDAAVRIDLVPHPEYRCVWEVLVQYTAGSRASTLAMASIKSPATGGKITPDFYAIDYLKFFCAGALAACGTHGVSNS